MHDDQMYYANLSYPEVEALLRSERKIVLLLPVSATEPHGPHAPLATDGLISLGMCRRAVRCLADDPELGAFILPSIDYGVTRYTRDFAGPIHIDEDALHAILTGVCRSLIRTGFRYIFVVNNHFEPEHIQTLHRSLDTIQETLDVTVGFLDLTRRERAAQLPEEFRRWGAHAGKYETSLVLTDEPQLVRQDIMRRLPEVPISLVDAIGAGLKDFKRMGLVDAYNGTPAGSTPEEGRKSFEVLTKMLVDAMRLLVRGEGGRDEPGFYNRTGRETSKAGEEVQ